MAATLLFGKLQAQFQDVGVSVQTLCLLLIGEFSFDDFTDLELPQFGIAFFWVYVLTSYLLMLNVLLALIIDA